MTKTKSIEVTPKRGPGRPRKIKVSPVNDQEKATELKTEESESEKIVQKSPSETQSSSFTGKLLAATTVLGLVGASYFLNKEKNNSENSKTPEPSQKNPSLDDFFGA